MFIYQLARSLKISLKYSLAFKCFESNLRAFSKSFTALSKSPLLANLEDCLKLIKTNNERRKRKFNYNAPLATKPSTFSSSIAKALLK